MGREGKEAGAHGESVGADGELGEAETAANRRRRSSVAEEGENVGTVLRGFSGHVSRRGGRGRHCGALGGVGEARGGWWPRRTALVATAPFGSEVRSERESRRRG